MTTGGASCPGCSGPLSPGALSCPACGRQLSEPSAPVGPPSARTSSPWYHRLQLAMLVWLIAYPVISCTPVILGTVAGGVSIGVAGLLVGATFFFPWLAGIVVIGILMLIAR